MMTVGLTGSIGMGKSTTARMFADAGAVVVDMDALVHDLYAPGGAGAEAVGALFDAVLHADGGVDRAKLRDRVQGDPEAFAALEAAIHPLVRAARGALLSNAAADGRAVAVIDIPLLFETGAQGEVDVVVVVSAPAAVQRERVLARPGMTQDAFEAILARQTPDADKRAQADFVVDTGSGLEAARADVTRIMAELTARSATRDPAG